MKKLLLAIIIAICFTSCSNYGKKINVAGTKAEVYYKGDGVTESDAKNVGDFLKAEAFFSSSKPASVQITKEGGAYIIRFVYDKKVYDTLKGADDDFKLIAAKASKQIFAGTKVNIALADETFNDYKTIAFDETVAKSLDAPAAEQTEAGKPAGYDHHNTVGGVNFYWKDISDEEAKKIADYIVENGAFAGGTAEIYMTKEDDRFILRFPMIESARTDPTYLNEVDKVSKQIKDNVFPDAAYSFIVTDKYMVTAKKWDY